MWIHYRENKLYDMDVPRELLGETEETLNALIPL